MRTRKRVKTFKIILMNLVGIVYHEEYEIDWDYNFDSAGDDSLACIISQFDGIRTLSDIVNTIPVFLRDHILEITCFLLR